MAGRGSTRRRRSGGGRAGHRRQDAGSFSGDQDGTLEEATAQVAAPAATAPPAGGKTRTGGRNRRAKQAPARRISQRDLWRTRALVRTRAIQRIREPYFSERLFALCGLEEQKAEKLRTSTLAKRAAEHLDRLEAEAAVDPDPLARAVALLGAELRLSPVEQSVLALAVTLSVDDVLRDIVGLVECAGPMELYAALAAVIDVDPAEVRRVLGRGGTLHETGLVRLSRKRGLSNEVPLRILDGLDEVLTGDVETSDDIIGRFFSRSPDSALSLEDVAHLREDFDVLLRILAPALQARQPGVNILVHGPPGTGKTELVRLLAAKLGVPLFQVADSDDEGDDIDRRLRFLAYVLCERMLSTGGPALVLFDEAEDVFPRGELHLLFGTTTAGSTGKAWTNRLLETNPVPTVWVSNQVRHMDPAYLRRFSQVVEIRRPPAAVRARLVKQRLEPHGVTEGFGRRAALDERLTPAHVDAAARALELASPSPGADADAVAGRILDGLLAVQGPPRPSPILHDGPAYDLSLLRASEDLGRLVDGLEQSGRGNVCLYGPPGIGKTAFVHHLATRLGRPLLLKRASDLLGPYVGMTEMAIAAMFREARDEGAVLLLDEADGMLRDRSGAIQRWELTQTNEMLTQMEAFDGIFFCATNLVDELDRASLRRFALKVRFDPPGEDARWQLFEAALAALGAGEAALDEARALRRAVDRLEGLTPGDVTAVIRRMRLLGEVPAGRRLVDALAEELVARREASSRAVGFGR